MKKLHPDHLEARWEGPFTVILSTQTVAKVAGKLHWIHHTRLKKFVPDPTDPTEADEQKKWRAVPTSDPMKVRLVSS